MVTLYTDWAARGNPGPGGYAAILAHQSHTEELVGAFAHTTNNRMELLAVIIGLEALISKPQQVHVYSDSKYVVHAVQKGWLQNWLKTDFKKKKNKDLWCRFWDIYQIHQVTLEWIRGHAGHPMNERCDTLAVQAAIKGPWKVDQGYLCAITQPLPS